MLRSFINDLELGWTDLDLEIWYTLQYSNVGYNLQEMDIFLLRLRYHYEYFYSYLINVGLWIYIWDWREGGVEGDGVKI